MWTWCCRKICPCFCCCCPCCCHGKKGDLVELLTSAENLNDSDLRSYSVRKVSSLRANSSLDDIDSSMDLATMHDSNISQRQYYAKQQLPSQSPAAFWQPTIYKVQPELDTSVESGSLSLTGSFNSRSRWENAFHTLRPSTRQVELPLDDLLLVGVSDPAHLAPVANSVPNLAANATKRKRNHFSLSKSSPKLRHSGTLGDVSKIGALDKHTNWLKSQSMQDVSLPQENTPLKAQPDEMALKYGINTSLYQMSSPRYPHVHRNQETAKPWRTASEEDCFMEPSYGDIQFSVAYLETCRKLFVHVARVQNLPAKGVCFKYRVAVKVSVLPNEKQSKVTQTNSGISDNGELSAEFADEFQFYLKDLAGHVLRMSVYDADFMGRYDAIGHALYYLEDMPSGRRAAHAMKLYKQSQPDQQPGSLEVSMQYDKKQDKVTIVVVQARNLVLSPQATHNWRSLDSFNTYVKVAYFCAGKKLKSSRSPKVGNTRNPVYDHKSEFILATNYPHEIYFVIQVLLPGLLLKRDPAIGRVIFGPFYYSDNRTETPWGLAVRTSEVVSHWYNMYL